jgi:cyclin H
MDTDLNKVQSKPPIYEESSQYKHWRFSPEKLWEIRKANVEAAINRVKQNIQEELVKYRNCKVVKYMCIVLIIQVGCKSRS